MSPKGNEGDRALNKYEGMFLLDNGKLRNTPEKGEEAIKATLEKNGVTIVQMGQWDERRLAYEVNRQKRGTYVLAHLEAPAGALEEVSRDLRLGGLISRHMFLRLKEFPAFMTARELEEAYGSKDFKTPGGRRPAVDSKPAPVAAVAAPSEEAAASAVEEAPAAEETAPAVEETPAAEESDESNDATGTDEPTDESDKKE